MSIVGLFVNYGHLVKFSHSVFALPFALSALVVAARIAPPGWIQVLWIILAVVSARTAAMTFNRIVDRDIDASNPRTQSRELPSGSVPLSRAAVLLCISSVVFLLCAGALGRHCLILAPAVLGLLFFYSLTKRFTSYCHLVLGLCLALAPAGVWYALTASVSLPPVMLMLGVITWVAGFDILYACQDQDFDRQQGLYSIPAELGIGRALQIARALHLATALFLGYFGWLSGLGSVFYVGWTLFCALLASQHFMVSQTDLSRINAAFFTRNGMASFVFFVAVLSDALFALPA